MGRKEAGTHFSGYAIKAEIELKKLLGQLQGNI